MAADGARETVTPPPSACTLSLPVMSVAVTGPPPESRSASLALLTVIPPPSAVTVSGPPRPAAYTCPSPESMSAAPVPTTVTPPPGDSAGTVTPDGTVTENPTLQSELAHLGAASVSRPRTSVWVTAGGPPSPEMYSIDSAILTGPPGAVVTLIGAP